MASQELVRWPFFFFFCNETKKSSEMISVEGFESPCVIGFNRSRLDEPSDFADGPGTRGGSRIYQHPQHAACKYHYRPDFDCFSLALILLEVDLWRPLADMVVSQKFSSLEDQRRYLLFKYAPLLDYSIGREYATAVNICLNGFGSPDFVQDASESTVLKFSDEVAKKLKGLNLKWRQQFLICEELGDSVCSRPCCTLQGLDLSRRRNSERVCWT